MEQEKYLSEEKYQETNKKVKKTSKILLIIGAILLVRIYKFQECPE